METASILGVRGQKMFQSAVKRLAIGIPMAIILMIMEIERIKKGMFLAVIISRALIETQPDLKGAAGLSTKATLEHPAETLRVLMERQEGLMEYEDSIFSLWTNFYEFSLQ